MENLEDIFKQTKGNINRTTEEIQQEQTEDLNKMIRKVELELTDRLRRYRLSSRVEANINGNLSELKHMLLIMNNGQTGKMAENVNQMLDTLNRKINEAEEEQLPEDEKQTEMSNSFFKVNLEVEESGRRNQEPKDEQYIKEQVQTAFNNILRNINSHIIDVGALSLGLDVRAVNDIQEIVKDSYRQCEQQAVQGHSFNINTVSQMINREIKGLEENVKASINKGKTQQNEKNETVLKPILEDPFALPAKQKEKVNENIARVTRETIERNENRKDEGDKEIEGLSSNLII